MTKGELIAALQGELMELSAECPVIIRTDTEYFWVKKIKHSSNKGLGYIVITT